MVESLLKEQEKETAQKAQKPVNGQENKKEITDSFLAQGIAIKISRPLSEIESIDYTEKAFEVLEYLNEAGALTISSTTKLLNFNRGAAGKALKCLEYAGLLRYVAVSTNTAIFKLYISNETIPPTNPNEACRMAALSLYYSYAKKEVPGFKWRLIRNKNSPLNAELLYTAKNKEGKITIDAPRRNEQSNDGADLFIFPTINEAKAKILKGKRFTTDLHLIQNNNLTLNEKTFEIN